MNKKEDKEMLDYARELLSDVRFESVIGCMARHFSGDDGYHSFEQLFWGALRDGIDEGGVCGAGEKDDFRVSTDERVANICSALDLLKKCTAVLSRSVEYENAIKTHRKLLEAGIDLDFVDHKYDNAHRLESIEDKLDLILECMLILTTPMVCREIEAARILIASQGAKAKKTKPKSAAKKTNPRN